MVDAMATNPESSSQLELTFELPQRQNRATVFFRFLMVIPQVFVLYFVGIGAFVMLIVGWFAALFTGRLPDGIAAFLQGYLRWSTRVNAYTYLMTDRYPPFSLDSSAEFPVDLHVETGRLNRLAVLFRYFIAIPAAIVASLLSIGMALFGIINWIATLIKGQQPLSFFEAYAAGLRYTTRFNGYFYMLTSFYPSQVMGEEELAASGAGHVLEAVDQSDVEVPVAEAELASLPTDHDVDRKSDRRWSLILSLGARKLVVVFFVLGAIGYAAVPLSLIALGSAISNPAVTAQNQAVDAYNTLAITAKSFEASSAACSQLTTGGAAIVACVESNDAKFATALDTYVAALQAINFPTAVSAEAAAAIAAATKASAAMKSLANAGSDAQSYQAAVSASDLQNVLNQVDSTFNQLNAALMTL